MKKRESVAPPESDNRRLKPKVVLSEVELDLLQLYKLLESSSSSKVSVAASDDKAKQKAALLAAAAARERHENEQRERQKQAALLRRKRTAEAEAEEQSNANANANANANVNANANANVSATVHTAIAPVAGLDASKQDDATAPQPAPKKISARPVLEKEWDVTRPGWPFVGLPLVEGPFPSDPHLAQNDTGFWVKVPLDMLPACLHPDMGVKKYCWIPKNKRSTAHFGYKKLIMQEIDFLSTYGEEGMLVIYAGAAPGHHIPIISQMFPHLRFILLDSAPFGNISSDRVQVRQDQTGNPYSEQNLGELIGKPGRKLFISDMHTESGPRGDAEQQYVQADMDRQRIWFQRLGAEHALLKFRLPWNEGSTTYLNGDVYFSCFGPQTTTETRLLVHKGCTTRDYDNKIYEEQMFYFNRMVRVQYYDHAVVAPGIDHCFDCSRMVQILLKHLARYNSWYQEGVRDAETGQLETELPLEALNAEVSKWIVRINEELEQSRHNQLNHQQQQPDQPQHEGQMEQNAQTADGGDKQPVVQVQQDEAVLVQGGANEEEEVDYGGLE